MSDFEERQRCSCGFEVEVKTPDPNRTQRRADELMDVHWMARACAEGQRRFAARGAAAVARAEAAAGA